MTLDLITKLFCNEDDFCKRFEPFWIKRSLAAGAKVRQRTRSLALSEIMTAQLKNISQIEHSRHRSFLNFIVNLLCGLIAYSHRDDKPSIYSNVADMQLQPLLS